MTIIHRGPGKRFACVTLILIVLAAIAAWARTAPEPTAARAGRQEKVAEPRGGELEVRIGVETLRIPTGTSMKVSRRRLVPSGISRGGIAF